MALVAGNHIGPYTLVASLGRGGMGEVFEAHDRRLDRRVAIKVLHSDLVGEGDVRDRVMREARAAARVTHPNIAAVYDVLEADGETAIVMELVAGQTLAAMITRGPVTPEQAVNIGIELADAAGVAHAAGVIHRDLKPSNVVLTPAGHVKILDFGIARVTPPASSNATTRRVTVMPDPQQGSRASGFAGTPRYAAPEQLTGRHVDGRADVFAIGAILFELLTARPAFDGEDALAIGLAILDGKTPPVSALNPKVPQTLSAVVARALRPEPADRFQTAGEFEAALRRALEPGESTPGDRGARKQVTSQERRRRWVRFAPVLLAFAIAVGVGLSSMDTPPVGARPLPVVAVLPLSDTTGPAAEAALGIGIADTLVVNLSGVPGVVVVKRLAPRGADISPLARELGATFVVDGSVQRAGDQLRLIVTLVRADGSVAWAGQFQGHADTLFDMQRRLAEGVAEALSLSLTPAGYRRQAGAGTNELEALAAYAEGRQMLERPDVPGNNRRAIDAFDQAVRQDPDFILARVSLGAAYWQAYRETSERPLIDQALDACLEARRRDPYQAAAYVTLADIYRGTGRGQDAVDALNRAVRLEPRNDDAYRALGETLSEQRRVEDARVAYERAIDLRPGYWRHYYVYGRFLYAQRDYAGAVRAFDRIIELQPDSSAGYLGLGIVYQTLDDLPRARQAYQQALEREFSAFAISNLGAIHHWEGRFDEAIAAYQQAAERMPNEPLFHRNLGDAWTRLGNREQAQAAYERAAQLGRERLGVNPASVPVRMELALAEAKIGRVDAALDLVNALVAEAPLSAEVRYTQAAVLSLAGQPDAALDALSKALALGYSATMAAHDDDLSAVRTLKGYEALLVRPPAAGAN